MIHVLFGVFEVLLLLLLPSFVVLFASPWPRYRAYMLKLHGTGGWLCWLSVIAVAFLCVWCLPLQLHKKLDKKYNTLVAPYFGDFPSFLCTGSICACCLPTSALGRGRAASLVFVLGHTWISSLEKLVTVPKQNFQESRKPSAGRFSLVPGVLLCQGAFGWTFNLCIRFRAYFLGSRENQRGWLMIFSQNVVNERIMSPKGLCKFG